MKGIHTLWDLLVQNDWLAKLDLKDAYFTVPIHPDHQKFLRFVVEQVQYQFKCLPFGLSCAPWAFTKVLRPVAAFLWTLGVRVIVYIDDMLIMGESPDVVKNHVTAMVALLEGLGFIVNMDKSVLCPTQQLEFLGLQVNSADLHLRLPGEKIKQIRVKASQLLRASSILGQAECYNTSSVYSPTFLSPPEERPAEIPVSERAGLQFLPPAICGSSRGDTMVAATSLPVERQIVDPAPRVDGDSFGCFLNWLGSGLWGDSYGGPWSPSNQEMHINCLELKAAALALQSLVKDQTGISVLLQLDSQTAVSYINHLGEQSLPSSQIWRRVYGCGPFAGTWC